MIQGKSASGSEPKDEIITLKMFSIVPKLETPDHNVGPNDDKKNFNQDFFFITI